jgi:hypothetical protein
MDMRYHWLTDRVRQQQKMSIGAQEKTILGIIIFNIIQRNITKIYAHTS